MQTQRGTLRLKLSKSSSLARASKKLICQKRDRRKTSLMKETSDVCLGNGHMY
jgi:hypothetical protein